MLIGTIHAQVFANQQPLNVCKPYPGTMNVVESISLDHDVEVEIWAEELVSQVDKASKAVTILISYICYIRQVYFHHI